LGKLATGHTSFGRKTIGRQTFGRQTFDRQTFDRQTFISSTTSSVDEVDCDQENGQLIDLSLFNCVDQMFVGQMVFDQMRCSEGHDSGGKNCSNVVSKILINLFHVGREQNF